MGSGTLGSGKCPDNGVESFRFIFILRFSSIRSFPFVSLGSSLPPPSLIAHEFPVSSLPGSGERADGSDY